MKTVKIVSKVLLYFTRFLAIAYFGMSAHSALALSTGWSLIIKEEGRIFQVCYPFTQKPFLLGEYHIGYILFEFLLPLALYGLFFLLLSNVFKVFFQPKLFTEYGVAHLRRFYWGNFVLPGLSVLLASIFAEVGDPAEILVVLHFILGIFAYFLAAIFRQGLQLQHEQDLII